jgi:phosphatidylglycerol:prolipoprotein diacylglycerol transferase
MRPFLFDLVIAGHHIRPPSYGLFLALGFSAAYLEALRRGKLIKANMNHIENLFLLCVLGSVTGSRLFHVLFEEFDYYLEHPWKVFAVWEGGYTLYGAVLMGLLFIFLYSRGKKINFLDYADIAGPAMMLGLFFGRIGCFLAGCCWGRAASVPWAVRFNDPESFCSLRGIPVHPTQIYEAVGGLVLFFYLNWRWKTRAFVGQIFFETVIGYSVLRFLVELYRGDDYRGYVFGGLFSYSQLISLFFLPFGIAGWVYFSRRTRKKA